MKITCTINGVPKTFYASAGQNLQALLQSQGYASVRNSDDSYGFTGSDTVIYDGKAVNAGLMIAAQADGHSIETVESLKRAGVPLSPVQSAMIDAGVVQSGYNAPAAALLITDLLKRIESPTKEDIKDALSSLYNRATGYQQFFTAVELAKARMKDPDYAVKVCDEFRDDSRGKSLC